MARLALKRNMTASRTTPHESSKRFRVNQFSASPVAVASSSSPKISADTILEILDFLPTADLTNYNSLSRNFFTRATEEVLWQKRCLRRVEELEAYSDGQNSESSCVWWLPDERPTRPSDNNGEPNQHHGNRIIEDVREKFGLSSYRNVFAALRTLSLVGTWHLVPDDPIRDFQGELLKIVYTPEPISFPEHVDGSVIDLTRLLSSHLRTEVVSSEGIRKTRHQLTFCPASVRAPHLLAWDLPRRVARDGDTGGRGEIPAILQTTCSSSTTASSYDDVPKPPCPQVLTFEYPDGGARTYVRLNFNVPQPSTSRESKRRTRVLSRSPAHCPTTAFPTPHAAQISSAENTGGGKSKNNLKLTTSLVRAPYSSPFPNGHNNLDSDIQKCLIPKMAKALEGLWVGPYGSHGLETISLQSVMSSSSTRVNNNTHTFCPVGFPRLEGMKILGDANVPTSKLSFAVDLLAPCDPTACLTADRRLVVSFPPDGYFVTDLALREPYILGWYRGMGQINRTKGAWNPAWVGLDFVVYRAGGPTEFSLVWDEKGEELRHIIDFQRSPLNGIDFQRSVVMVG